MATDRISAFDYVLATGIPHKGRVLTQISLFWFEFLRDLVPNHLLTADVSQYPAPLQKYADQLRGRSMIVARADMFPVECVVRGYISGSAWKEYKATGRVCGIELPKGLQESERLPEPIFTPSTKATSGHDENISFAEMTKLVGAGTEPAAARPHSGGLQQRPRIMRGKKALSLRTPSSSSGAPRRASLWRTRCLLRTLPASGRRTSTLPAGPRSRSTSNTFGTIWKKFAGTSSRRRRHFPLKWRNGPARSTSRRTTSSPDSSWMFNAHA